MFTLDWLFEKATDHNADALNKYTVCAVCNKSEAVDLLL